MSYRKKRRDRPECPESHEQLTLSDAPRQTDKRFLNPAVLRMLSTSKLTSGLPYQRPIDERNVEKLIREWNNAVLDPLVVSFRDNRFYLVDGQHRVSAMRKMNGGNDLMVMCKIHTGLTYEEEADLCYQLDQSKTRLTMAQSAKALMESGKNAEVQDIHRLIEQNGFTWIHGKKYAKPYEIIATQMVISAYRLLGSADFSRMLGLLNSVWHGDPYSLSGAFISGMALFLKTYSAKLKDHIFIRRLSGVAPEVIIQDGKQDFTTNKRTLRYARAILNKYNSMHGGRGLEYKFKE